MGLLLGALGGAGQAIGEIADSNIKKWNQEELNTQNSQLELSKLKALEKIKAESSDNQRMKMVGDIDTGAKGIIAQRFQGHEVADKSTWTPEQQAALDQGKGLLQSEPRVRAQAAAGAGYFDEAAKLDKMAESGASTVPWGSTRVDSEGNVIYDNGAQLKGSIAQQGADDKTAGKGKKADHFDEKQWDAAAKIDKSTVSLPNAMGDKDVESGDLRSFYMKTFNEDRASGDLAPNEAAEHATTRVVRIKNEAARRVAQAQTQDKNSKLTLDQAVKDVIKEGNAFQAKESQSSNTNRGNAVLDKSITDLIAKDAKANGIETPTVRIDAPQSGQKLELSKEQGSPPAVVKSTQPAMEYEVLKDQAKALDPKIAELRRDYNLATSVRGSKGVAPGVVDRIKAQLNATLAQQRELEDRSDVAYRNADRDIVSQRANAQSSLNTKYAQ